MGCGACSTLCDEAERDAGRACVTVAAGGEAPRAMRIRTPPAPTSSSSPRRSLTWTVLSPRRKLRAGRASLPGATAVVTPVPSARPGSAPQYQPSPSGRPPRPRPAATLTPPTLIRPGSAPDPAMADEAAARLRQVFRQRAALAHAAWPDGGEGRGDTWPSPFRVRGGGDASLEPRGRAPQSPLQRVRTLEDSPSRMHSGKGWGVVDAKAGPQPSFGDRHRGAMVAAAAACVAAAHWRTVATILTTLAPSPASAVLMVTAVALLAASGVFNLALTAGRDATASALHGLASVERLCGVIDSLGLLPILLARLEAELGAVGTDICTIRRKADWLPSRPRGRESAAAA